MKLKELLIESLEKDTRDDSNLYVYRLKSGSISKTDFQKVRNTLKNVSCYYSKFKKGFICKNKVNLENIKVANVIADKEAATSTTNVKYNKLLKDYISKEELETYIKDIYAPKHLNNSWFYGKSESLEKDLEKFIEHILSRYENKYDTFNTYELRYIRQVIIHKSLGLALEDLKLSGLSPEYEAIYNKLPIIKDLKLTDEYFTAMWGYDQTNVDIAKRLNKKVWGLDIFKDITGCDGYWLVRVKENRFSDKNKVKNYHLDKQPFETFQADASVTGNYR